MLYQSAQNVAERLVRLLAGKSKCKVNNFHSKSNFDNETILIQLNKEWTDADSKCELKAVSRYRIQMESWIEEVKQLKDWFFSQVKKKWTDVDCKCGLKVVTRDRIGHDATNTYMHILEQLIMGFLYQIIEVVHFVLLK